jgi:hypothetical protein
VVTTEERARPFLHRRNGISRHQHFARAGRLDAADQVEQRAFAAAAFAQQHGKLSFTKLAADLIQHQPRLVSFGKSLAQRFELNHRLFFIHSHTPC